MLPQKKGNNMNRQMYGNTGKRLLSLGLALLMLCGSFFNCAYLFAATPARSVSSDTTSALVDEKLSAANGESGEDSKASGVDASEAIDILQAPLTPYPELNTEYSTAYKLPNGSYRSVISQVPVNYLADDGLFEPIDTRLIYDPVSKEHETKATEDDITFLDGLDPYTLSIEGNTGDKDKAEESSYEIKTRLLSTSPGSKLTLGNKALYLGAEKNTSLEYEITSTGVKETIYLTSADVPVSYHFEIALKGLTPRQNEYGKWELCDLGSGEVVYTLSDLIIFDSSQNEADEPAFCKDAEMTVVPIKDALLVTYSFSREWLRDPARVFPVQVDPGLTKGASDTFVSSAFPSTNYASSLELKVGLYDASTGNNRALLQFDISSIPAYATVKEATLKVFQEHTYYVDTATTTYLGLVKKAWVSSNTWTGLGCKKTAGVDTGLAEAECTPSPVPLLKLVS